MLKDQTLKKARTLLYLKFSVSFCHLSRDSLCSRETLCFVHGVVNLVWLKPRLVGKQKAQISKNPQFCSQKLPTKNRHKIVAVSVAFWASLFSHIVCLVLLVSPYFQLFHDTLEPQNSPPNEVTGS